MDLPHKKFGSDGAPKVPAKPRIVDGGAISKRDETPTGITLKQLIKNYDSIFQVSAIFYPVAYHFVRELGRGRQGRIFLALRQGARGCITEHAIKVFDPAIYRNPQEYWTDMGRIAYQISKLHQLQTPHLVSRYTYEETYGIGYIQLEAIDGFGLRRFIRAAEFERVENLDDPSSWSPETANIFRLYKGNLCMKPGVVVYILRGVLKGLERLHSAGFLHCDLKPGNIMIDRLGIVKVVDFGRAVIASERLTFLLGSPMYMAPEMHRRETCDLQADMFSLGLVALEMLRGRTLSESDETSEEKLLEIKMGLKDNLHELLPTDVLENERLLSIISKFLEPDPAKRHATAKDADVGERGLRMVDKSLDTDQESEYSRDLSEYLAKHVNEHTQRVELSFDDDDRTDASI